MNAVGIFVRSLHFRKKTVDARFRFSVQQVWKTLHPPLQRPLEPSTKSSPPPSPIASIARFTQPREARGREKSPNRDTRSAHFTDDDTQVRFDAVCGFGRGKSNVVWLWAYETEKGGRERRGVWAFQRRPKRASLSIWLMCGRGGMEREKRDKKKGGGGTHLAAVGGTTPRAAGGLESRSIPETRRKEQKGKGKPFISRN